MSRLPNFDNFDVATMRSRLNKVKDEASSSDYDAPIKALVGNQIEFKVAQYQQSQIREESNYEAPFVIDDDCYVRIENVYNRIDQIFVTCKNRLVFESEENELLDKDGNVVIIDHSKEHLQGNRAWKNELRKHHTSLKSRYPGIYRVKEKKKSGSIKKMIDKKRDYLKSLSFCSKRSGEWCSHRRLFSKFIQAKNAINSERKLY